MRPCRIGDLTLSDRANGGGRGRWGGWGEKKSLALVILGLPKFPVCEEMAADHDDGVCEHPDPCGGHAARVPPSPEAGAPPGGGWGWARENQAPTKRPVRATK